MKFNIVSDLNINLLNNKLNKYLLDNDETPIMLMSPKTMNAVATSFQKIEGLRLNENGIAYESNIVGIFRGYKIFADPEMAYGEVDIR